MLSRATLPLYGRGVAGLPLACLLLASCCLLLFVVLLVLLPRAAVVSGCENWFDTESTSLNCLLCVACLLLVVCRELLLVALLVLAALAVVVSNREIWFGKNLNLFDQKGLAKTVCCVLLACCLWLACCLLRAACCCGLWLRDLVRNHQIQVFSLKT